MKIAPVSGHLNIGLEPADDSPLELLGRGDDGAAVTSAWHFPEGGGGVEGGDLPGVTDRDVAIAPAMDQEDGHVAPHGGAGG